MANPTDVTEYVKRIQGLSVSISDTYPPQIFPGFFWRPRPIHISMIIVIMVQ